MIWIIPTKILYGYYQSCNNNRITPNAQVQLLLSEAFFYNLSLRVIISVPRPTAPEYALPVPADPRD